MPHDYHSLHCIGQIIITQNAMLYVTDPMCEVIQPVVTGRRGILMCRMTYEYQATARQFHLPPHINVSLSWAGVPETTVSTTADPREYIGTLETNMTVEDVTSNTIHSQTCTITFTFSPGIGRYQYAVNTVSYPCQPTPLSSCKCHSTTPCSFYYADCLTTTTTRCKFYHR